MKNELIKNLSRKISVTERNIAFRGGYIYEYILTFAVWWSISWEVVGSGGYILAGGGWWWIYFGWWWVVVDGGGWWSVVVGGGIV